MLLTQYIVRYKRNKNKFSNTNALNRIKETHKNMERMDHYCVKLFCPLQTKISVNTSMNSAVSTYGGRKKPPID